MHNSREMISANPVDNKIREHVHKHVHTSPVNNRVHYSVCQQTFNRPGDLERHKYLAERSLPIEELSNV